MTTTYEKLFRQVRAILVDHKNVCIFTAHCETVLSDIMYSLLLALVFKNKSKMANKKYKSTYGYKEH